jgi:hypothetical protein
MPYADEDAAMTTLTIYDWWEESAEQAPLHRDARHDPGGSRR